MISDTRIEVVRRRCARGFVEVLTAASLALVFAFWPGAAAAAVFLVDTALDSHDQNLGDGLCSDPGGMCSLRAGVEEANALGGPDTISLDVVGPYDLTLGQLVVTSDMTILANGEVIRWAGGGGRLIQVQSGSLTLEDATLREGNQVGLGGALENNALTNLVRCTIIDNSNVLQGGGLSNSGPAATLNIIDSAVLNNSSGRDGGGIYNESGTVNIANSTVSGNRADDDGAGIYSAFGTVNATNLTVSRNTADHDNDGTGSGGGLYQYGSTFELKGTIVAGNFDTPGNAGPSASHPDLAGQTFASQGHNLIGNVSDFDFSSNTTGDHYGDPNGTTTPHASAVEESEPIDPLLGGLTGAPPLLRLLEGSPAIDWLPVAECNLLSSGTNPLFNPGDPLAVDQEGDPRPLGLDCDQGSDEAEEDPPLFSDGFESGDTSVWSASTIPQLHYYSSFETTDPAFEKVSGAGIFSNAPSPGTAARTGTQVITNSTITTSYTGRAIQSVDCLALLNDTDPLVGNIYGGASTANGGNVISGRIKMLWFTDSGCTTPHATADTAGTGIVMPEGSYVAIGFDDTPPIGTTHFKIRFEVHDNNGGSNAQDDWAADDVTVVQ